MDKYSGSLILLFLTLILTGMTCKVKQEQSSNTPNGTMKTEKRAMPDTLPPPSPEEVEKQEVSSQLIAELAGYLTQQTDMSEYAALVNRLQGKNLFPNAGHQGYRILALSNKAFQNVPERERQMLTDASGANLGYQMKFFIHHTCPEPFNPYIGYAYRTLSGKDLKFANDSVSIPDLKRTVALKKEGQVGSKLHVFRLTGPLFY